MHKRHLGRASREGRLFRHRTARRRAQTLRLVLGARAARRFPDTDRLRFLPLHARRPLPKDQLGYATDLGRPTAELIDHLRGVDILAIEQLLPLMQEAADRPRWSGPSHRGSSHISNQQCSSRWSARSRRPARRPAPPLPGNASSPELAARRHRDADYELFIQLPDRPTPWLDAPRPRKHDGACPGRHYLRNVKRQINGCSIHPQRQIVPPKKKARRNSVPSKPAPHPPQSTSPR